MFYFRAYVGSLERQIDDLKERLRQSEAERTELLSRLLEKHNYQPLAQSAASEMTTSQPPIQVISPFNSIPFDAQDAIKESILKEETEYIMSEQGIDETRARALAEDRFTAGTIPIH